MRFFHVLSLPLLAITAVASSPAQEDTTTTTTTTTTNNKDNNNNSFKNLYSSPNEAFQDLLNALPEESIHAALVNSLSHFRDGIFESDRHGVEHIHQDNPPLATKLIVAAVQDLKKKRALGVRQASNGTTTAAPASSTSKAAEPSSTTTSAVLVPVPVTTTDSRGKATVTSVDVLSAATASVTVQVTTTNSRGETTTLATAKPAVVVSTTDAAGQPTQVTSAVEFAPTAGQVMTTTNAKGSTMVTTYTPDGGRVSSIVLKTTTGDDGKPTVVTSYTYVEPAGATQTNPSKTSQGRPGLQSGAAIRGRGMDAVAAGGVGGLIGLLLI